MIEYRFATPQDMPEVIDFIDLVFSQLQIPHDFETLLPKAYGDGADTSSQHAIALDHGRVVGCLGCYVFPQTINGKTLQIGYLGSMSVHRHARGAGIMKVLMQMQIDKARADGLDLLALGGQRQRYEYHGFIPAGGKYHYRITAANVRHALADVNAEEITFTLMNEGEEAACAWQLYQQQPVCGARTPENFVVTCCSYKARPWTIRRNGQMAGYLIASPDSSSLSELVLKDHTLIPAVLKAWLSAQAISSVSVAAMPYDVCLNRTLSRFAESYELSKGVMLLPLHDAEVIHAYMSLKHTLTPLSDGKLVLGQHGKQNICIAVQNGILNVANTTDAADITLSPMEAVHLLYSYNRFSVPELAFPIPADWFPLPLAIPTADSF